MKYILFLMFFTAPPTLSGKDQSWALQSTSSMEFESEQACKASVTQLIAAVRLTDTVKLFGWCFSSKGGTGDNAGEISKGDSPNGVRPNAVQPETDSAPNSPKIKTQPPKNNSAMPEFYSGAPDLGARPR